ncbi:hypothetical protein F5Y19DRAFT_479279 [Xylariaceae sp. FL1651]|nr:hypothetical protein F5Y19DRAFT_479279 [Xylariaceae sp. FL1651]
MTHEASSNGFDGLDEGSSCGDPGIAITHHGFNKRAEVSDIILMGHQTSSRRIKALTSSNLSPNLMVYFDSCTNSAAKRFHEGGTSGIRGVRAFGTRTGMAWHGMGHGWGRIAYAQVQVQVQSVKRQYPADLQRDDWQLGGMLPGQAAKAPAQVTGSKQYPFSWALVVGLPWLGRRSAPLLAQLLLHKFATGVEPPSAILLHLRTMLYRD